MAHDYLFTSESVAEGHPDKMSDQISDAILDAVLREDRHARVACETILKTGLCLIAGEISTTARPDYEAIMRQTIRDIGYDHSDKGFDANTCSVMIALGLQSPDINQGVDRARPEDQGAGDQGIMFGYATNETDVLMPAAIEYAHRLVEMQSRKRRDGTLPQLRPDAKSQVTLRYRDGKPVAIDAVVLSTQHAAGFTGDTLREAVMEDIIKPVLGPTGLLTAHTAYHINPTGKVDDDTITALVREHFDLRPYGILKMLNLLDTDRIQYRKTAAYGHFGREQAGFTWEHTDKAEALSAAATG